MRARRPLSGKKSATAPATAAASLTVSRRMNPIIALE
jgi:hypothetical protein